MFNKIKNIIQKQKKCLGIIGLFLDLFGAVSIGVFYSNVIPHPGGSWNTDEGEKFAIALIPNDKIWLYVGFGCIVVGFFLLLIKEIVSD